MAVLTIHIALLYFVITLVSLTSKQFGFRPKLSTNTALTHFTDNVLLKIDSGRLTGLFSWMILLKVIDTVDHNLLLYKLKLVRLLDDTVNWFQSYLTNRKQRTSVGVSSGSILGLPLFLIYVNDLPLCQLASEIILYADDSVIYYSSTDLLT